MKTSSLKLMNFLQLQVYNGKIALESVQMAHGHNVCKRAGFVAKVKEHANPERVTFTHDMIYREALAAKQFSLDLDIVLLDQGWPSFLCKAPTLLPTRVGCAINVGQGWPTFSVHAPKFFATQTFTSRCATQTFISFHCLQTCSGIFIL